MAKLPHYTFEKGESKRIGIKVNQYDDQGVIVNPPTITITDPKITVYKCPDMTTPVLAQTDALLGTIPKGLKITYNITASGSMGIAGEYIAVFEYDRDAIEHRKKNVKFQVLDLAC